MLTIVDLDLRDRLCFTEAEFHTNLQHCRVHVHLNFKGRCSLLIFQIHAQGRHTSHSQEDPMSQSLLGLGFRVYGETLE